MQETIEINIEKQSPDTTFHNGDTIYFSPVDGSIPYNCISVITAAQGTQLTINSQLFYERIPFSLIGKGIQINLFQSSRNDKLIGTGTITNRFFDQIKREDWKIDKTLITDNSKTVNSNIQLSDEEKKFVELGFKPLSMDDKWFLYWESNTLHGIRSWTGLEYFLCSFERQNDQWKIIEIQVSNEWDDTIEAKLNAIESLIKQRLLVKEKLKYNSFNT